MGLRQAQTDRCFHNCHFVVYCNAELVRVVLKIKQLRQTQYDSSKLKISFPLSPFLPTFKPKNKNKKCQKEK